MCLAGKSGDLSRQISGRASVLHRAADGQHAADYDQCLPCHLAIGLFGRDAACHKDQ